MSTDHSISAVQQVGRSEYAYRQILERRGKEYIPFEYRYFRKGVMYDARKVWPHDVRPWDRIRRPPPPMTIIATVEPIKQQELKLPF